MKRVTLFAALLLFLSAPSLAQTSFDTPRSTFDAYMKACSEGDYGAAEGCFTKSSRELLKAQSNPQEPRDPQQLKAVYDAMSKLEYTEERVSPTRAVMWPNDKSVAPLLLRIQDKSEGWRIDYHFMSHYIKADDNGWSWRNPKLFTIWKSRP